MNTNPGAAQEPASRFIGAGAWRRGLSYGLLGLPLAFVALPLYVILPNHYAREFGAPLALLGLVLLAARLVDAVLDPLIGRWCDRLFARSIAAVLGASAVAAVVLALGLWGLLFPPEAVRVAGTTALLSWAGLLMAITYTAYSVVAVAHQSWGARLGGNEAQRSRVVAWREGLSLLGVLIAAVLPATLGLGATVATFAVLLTLGWWAWSRSATPIALKARGPAVHLGPSPLRQPAFLRLLAVFVINGTASAVPATLVLFFVQDRLQASSSVEPAFLATYFLCAALSIPLWVRLVARIGLARTWLVGMALAVVVFIWAATLGAGDVVPFLIVCALSGIALGTDLTLPSAMLAGLIGQLGERGQREGAYFGWWSFATKLNLALAAGLALPLLALFGYEPGARDPAALQTLTIAYCLLPCALKLLAGGALYALVIRPEQRTGLVPHASIPS
ncbi:MFS transporter [Hydrogenophaga sp.]|uniref:MFS transporter n=1 Tax=Hydrogenophaga sp. TaxID=1904254 RepID=UPI0027310B7B|nr:MFS transporter [Hydrogenophaga sp.]MDP2017058.1 MFS transporter [Hydrogenophaga sp.]MDP3164692.1 MFS transporter [Hydrogenophaga sp.]